MYLYFFVCAEIAVNFENFLFLWTWCLRCIPANQNTVKLGNKELIDKEQIGIKAPFPVTNLPFTS